MVRWQRGLGPARPGAHPAADQTSVTPTAHNGVLSHPCESAPECVALSHVCESATQGPFTALEVSGRSLGAVGRSGAGRYPINRPAPWCCAAQPECGC